MPKRVIDGDALWVSEKLTRVPDKYRVEYAWLLPLANANGCFECSPMLVWRCCYSALRKGWEIDDVAAMLDAFEQAKMLFRFQQGGKTFGFFIGCEKEGRLPPPSLREKSAKQWQTGMLPLKELAKFTGLTTKQCSEQYRDLLASNSRPTREKSGSKSTTGNGHGDGDGIGSGCGEGLGDGKGVGSGTGDGRQDGGTANTAIQSAQHSLPSANSSSLTTDTTQHNNTDPTPFSIEDEADELAEDDELMNDDESESQPDEMFRGLTETGFASLFRHIIRANPNAEEPPRGWKDNWAKDFKKLRGWCSDRLLIDIIAVSQIEKNQPFYVRPLKLVENFQLLATMVKEREKAMPVIRSEFKKTVRRLHQEGHDW